MNALDRQALIYWAVLVALGILGLAAEVFLAVTIELSAVACMAIAIVCMLTFVQAWRTVAARR